MRSLFSFLAVIAVDVIFLALYTHEAVLEDDLNGGTEMDVELKSFTNCENYPSMPMMFTDLQISQVAKKKFAVNGGVELNMTVNNDIMAEVTVMECADSTSDDNCEFVATLRGSQFCDKITKKDSPWYDFVKETDIRNICPVKPGSYVFDNAPLDFKDAEGVPLTPGHWKIRMELFPKNFEGDAMMLREEPIGCNMVEVSVSPKRGGELPSP